jgi:hypothetical protein
MLSSTVTPPTGFGSAPLQGPIALSPPGSAEDDAVLRVVAVVRPFGTIPLQLASPPHVALLGGPPPAAAAAMDLPVIATMAAAAEEVGVADPAFATPERVFPLRKRIFDAGPVPGAPKRQRLIRHLNFPV